MDPLAVKLLIDIVNKTNCKIVVSSDWRLDKEGVGPGSDFQKEMDRGDPSGIVRRSIIGVTPDCNIHPQLSPTAMRGEEIQLWINTNNFDGNFVIVDDHTDMAHLHPYFIKTETEAGLTPEIANEIIFRLNRLEDSI